MVVVKNVVPGNYAEGDSGRGSKFVFVTIHALPSFTTVKWRLRLWWPMMVTSAFAAMTTTASWVLLYLHPLAIAADYGNGACEQEEAYYCDFNAGQWLLQGWPCPSFSLSPRGQ
ncbi:uncharacterized protein ACA1_182070 [Acanthamoeba castellanii str. Neff]|uniref:Uncharacterized protein n=1 Tax=Acanthamoeba castellanii (strain ATCC 30010 / Neff) TaxID=1257118 RepID=L8HA42_ACACF|nr:uncharacterized protein ACA1_182070 [Acanthamoeba castellanii str. Neff]ELR21306.1 hypothetical protein ACA1_182070 [Acanthamoeba castellanii str. Neff]